jgi:dihydroxyacid dehydratase/phosphogluconate dehydratase
MQMGYGPEDWAGKPVIAIINTWSDINPCHAHFKQRVEDVKRGVLQAGGFPLELPALSLAENFVKPTTMLYRNMLAMEVEELLRSHPVDGAVLMGGCDKTTPGLLMGAIRQGLPFVYLPAGPMLRGNWNGKTWARARTPGSSGTSGAPARSPMPVAGNRGRHRAQPWHLHDHGHGRHHDGDRRGDRPDLAGRLEHPGGGRQPPAHVAACGRRIVDMVWEDLTPAPHPHARQLSYNAIAVAMAMGCSTNAIIHLVAMSRRAGTHMRHRPGRLRRRQPPCAGDRQHPALSGEKYLMEDFYYAGGLPALLMRLAPHPATGAMTVTGRTWARTRRRRGLQRRRDPPAGQPHLCRRRAGVLRGNIAPGGCVIKPSACAPQYLQHTGPAWSSTTTRR